MYIIYPHFSSHYFSAMCLFTPAESALFRRGVDGIDGCVPSVRLRGIAERHGTFGAYIQYVSIYVGIVVYVCILYNPIYNIRISFVLHVPSCFEVIVLQMITLCLLYVTMGWEIDKCLAVSSCPIGVTMGRPGNRGNEPVRALWDFGQSQGAALNHVAQK